jgi:hypothetical protein
MGVGRGRGVTLGLAVPVGVGVAVEVGVAVAVAVGVTVGVIVAVGVADGQGPGARRLTSSTNMSVGLSALSSCTKNLMRTVIPANGVMSKPVVVQPWMFVHVCRMVARTLPDVSVT